MLQHFIRLFLINKQVNMITHFRTVNTTDQRHKPWHPQEVTQAHVAILRQTKTRSHRLGVGASLETS